MIEVNNSHNTRQRAVAQAQRLRWWALRHPWAALALLLGAVGYRGFVSVEMAHTDVDTIRRTMDYIAEVFA